MIGCLSYLGLKYTAIRILIFDYTAVSMFVKGIHQLLAIDGVKYNHGKYYTVDHSDGNNSEWSDHFTTKVISYGIIPHIYLSDRYCEH